MERKLNRLITSVISLLACLILLVAGTFAWKAVNKSLETRNISMTIQPVSDVTTISCYALRYDGTLGAVCFKIGENAQNGEVLNVPMTEFDRIFRDRIVNTPLIYVLELGNVPNNTGSSITIKVPCTERFILPSNGVATNYYVDNGSGAHFSIQDYISNIVSVKIGCGGEITDPTPTTSQRIENNVNIFNTQLAAFRAITSGSRMAEFVTITSSNGTTTYSKVDSVQIQLTQSEYTAFLYDAEDEDGGTSKHLTLYIQFDYDEALMDAYIAHMTNDLDTDVDFASDLGVIQMLVGAGSGS